MICICNNTVTFLSVNGTFLANLHICQKVSICTLHLDTKTWVLDNCSGSISTYRYYLRLITSSLYTNS